MHPDDGVDLLRNARESPAGTATEILRESPLSRYVTGMLAPFGTDVPDEERDDQLTGGGDDDEGGSVDVGPPISQALTPSSIGLSFLVASSTKSLAVTATWGDYHVEEIPEDDAVVAAPAGGEEPAAPADMDQERVEPKRRRPRRVWARTPRQSKSLVIDLKPDAGLQRQEIDRDDGVTIEHLCRRLADRYAVSIRDPR